MFSTQDLFHWQIMDGNLTGNIREFLPLVGERGLFAPPCLLCSHPFNPPPRCPLLPLRPQVEPEPPTCRHLCLGHVQVAQVPGRGEPDSPGELNFPYLFQLLEDEGYEGFVGCEYRPQGEGAPGLRAWGKGALD